MENYIKKHKRPIVAIDVAVFTIIDNDLKVMLAPREREPFKGNLALVGGFVNVDETFDAAVKRFLRAKAGITDLYTEQLYTFGAIDRDPRDRVISIAYYALVKPEHLEQRKNAHLLSVKKIKDLPFDHCDILRYAVQRLKGKITYSTIVFTLLPKLFTLVELRRIYETVLDKKLDRSNFRRKILSRGIIKKTDRKRKNETDRREPFLYTFTGKLGDEINLF